MDLNLLKQPHSFRTGDSVVITERNYSDKSYSGTIERILSGPINKYYTKQIYVDHFYIKFDESIYHEILKRGWNIIYKDTEAVLGNIVYAPNTKKIEKIYIQYDFIIEETEINLSDIDAILIWRVGYDIQPNR
jgi:hypothetical protein